LANREVVRYLAGADMVDLMGPGRGEASEELLRRIQAQADERKLGARLVSLGLQDLHPPMKVAPEFEKVITALQVREAKILTAQADAIKTNALADARAALTLDRAQAERKAREIGALAQAALFTNQIPAFAAAPAVYTERQYLDTFTRSTTKARKYLLLTTNTQDVLTFDLQDKIREDILNLNVPSPKK
jgi:regulator of protease activity HflC (stomatin/prohibitin superfamily)